MPELGVRAKMAILIVAATLSMLHDVMFRFIAVLLLGLLLLSLSELRPQARRRPRARKIEEAEEK